MEREKCIFSKRDESSALIAPRTHQGPANSLANKLVPPVGTDNYTTKGNLQRELEQGCYLRKKFTGIIHGESRVDLSKRAHRVPESRAAGYYVVEPRLVMR